MNLIQKGEADKKEGIMRQLLKKGSWSYKAADLGKPAVMPRCSCGSDRAAHTPLTGREGRTGTEQQTLLYF